MLSLKILNKEAYDHNGLIYVLDMRYIPLVIRAQLLKEMAEQLEKASEENSIYETYRRCAIKYSWIIRGSHKSTKQVCQCGFYSGFVYDATDY